VMRIKARYGRSIRKSSTNISKTDY